MEGASQGRGLFASARALGATLLDIASTRAELALIELKEEGERRKVIVAWLAAAGFCLALGIVFASVFVIAWFWDTHRLAAIAGTSLFYLGAAAAAFAHVSARMRASPPPFEATLRELAADRAALRGAHD